MSYPTPRSLNAELRMGTRDGSAYSDTPNRGGLDRSEPAGMQFKTYRRLYGVR